MESAEKHAMAVAAEDEHWAVYKMARRIFSHGIGDRKIEDGGPAEKVAK